MYNEKNDGFSVRDIFIQLLFIILFVFILVWLFPTKASVNNQFADLNNRLDALTSGIFNDNLQTMKDAAVSYYTTERLPANINDVKSMTLKEMLAEKLLVEFTDANGNSCSLTDSYVEVVKLEDEYQMKINLSCTDNDAYIIVHLGCYDYCDASGVCEKEETTTITTNNPTTPIIPTTKTCTYEYKLVTNGQWGNYGSWTGWSKDKVTTTDYRQVEMKKEQVITGTKQVQTGTKVETINAYSSTTTYCPSGYSKNSAGTKCVRTSSAYYKAKCPDGYTLSNGVCYGTNVSTVSVDPVCPSGYTRSGTTCYKTGTSQVTMTPSCPSGYSLSGNYCYKTGSSTVTMTPSCPSGYKLSGNNCYKTVTSGGTTTYTRGAYVTTKTGTSVPSNSSSYYYETVSSDYVYDCSSTCAMRTVYTYKVYKAVATTSGGGTTTLTTSASCATNYSLSNGVCYKTVDASDKTAASCATNYVLSNGVCYKTTTTTDTKSATCPSGYSLSGQRCYKSNSSTVTLTPSCPTGYTLSGERCYGTVSSTTSLLTSTSYSCPSGYTLSGSTCSKTVPVFGVENVYETVTYYRYKEREYISGTVKTVWSKSDNDTTLINQGYSLTGNKKCS
jgi:hypothetical protein